MKWTETYQKKRLDGLQAELTHRVKLKQHVQEIIINLFTTAAARFDAAGDDRIEEVVEPRHELSGAAAAALQVEPGEHGEEVREVGLGDLLDGVPHQHLQLLRLVGAEVGHHVLGEERAGDEVEHAREHGAAHVHGGLAGVAAQAGDQLPHPFLPRGARGVQRARREEVVGAHGAEPLPQRAGGREPDDGVLVVPQRAPGVAHRPRRQHVVVPLQHVARRRGGGDHDGVGGAQPQGHHRAVRRGEPGEGVVRLATELQDVADERQRRRARRCAPPRLAGARLG